MRESTYFTGRFIFRYRWLVYLAVFVPMVFIRWHQTNHWLTWLIGGLLILTGAIIRLYAAFYIGWKGTPDDPLKRKLTTSGPYRFTRNPLYWGNIVGFAGAAVIFKLFWYVPISAGVIFLLHHLLIVWYEEHRMREKYTDEYQEYCKQVPRWGPRLFPTIPLVSGIRQPFPLSRVLLAELGTIAGFIGTLIIAVLKEFYSFFLIFLPSIL